MASETEVVYTNSHRFLSRILRTSALFLLAAGVLVPVFAGGDEPLGRKTRVLERVSAAVGRDVDIKMDRNKTVGAWTLICGEPVELDGRPLDIQRSDLPNPEFGAHFCILLNDPPGGETDVVEFDIGSNDVPAIGWIEKYHLPAALLMD